MGDTEVMQDEQDVSTLSDEQLNAELGGSGEHEQVEGNEPKSQGEPEKTEEEGGSEQPQEVDLKAEVEELRSRLEEAEHKASHWRHVGNQHSQEISEVRAFKQRLLDEKQAREQADPMQTFIDNPQQYRQDIMQDVRREQQIVDLDRQEQALIQQQRVAESANFLRQNCPDLRDNLDDITEILREAGDPDERIAAFRNNPAMFPPGLVMAINHSARQRKAYRELQTQFDTEKAKNAEMLQRIEQTAKHRPMTNAASGSTSGSGGTGLSDITEADIANLSDDELNNLLSA